ncbi:MAG TPA: transposase [Trebonia sp.]|jgi:hypothetical protein|nr:transposase [Trebonia sp.]
MPDDGIGADELSEFCHNLFFSFARADQRRWGEMYVRGLVTVPGRKTVKKISDLVAGGGAEQCLQQFVNQSTWDWGAVRRDLAVRMIRELEPRAWVVKEIVFPKNGASSVGVARQFTHSTGRVLNCQRAIAVFLAGPNGSCAVNWRLALPPAWDENAPRRGAAKIPEDERCLPIWRHALDALDEMVNGWGLSPAPVIADVRLERHADALTAGLESLGLDFVLQVAGNSPAMTVKSGPAAPLTLSFSDVITQSLKRSSIPMSTWQIPAAQPGRAPFVVTRLPVGASAGLPVPPARPAAPPARHRAPLRSRPPRFVAAEWSAIRRSAKSTWLTTVDALRQPSLVELTELSEQVESELDDFYTNTGLLHFEGRSFPGWHHYVTLVSVARAWSRRCDSPRVARLAFN